MTNAVKGVLAMIGASVIWGISPIFYKMLSHVPPVEVVAHRTIWSCTLLFLVLIIRGRLEKMGQLVKNNDTAIRVLAAAVLISINWLCFVWAIHNERATEASFGYYVYPLLSVLFGFFVFKERLSPIKWCAISMALFAVVLLAASQGIIPWVALVLSVTLGLYGVIKKQLNTNPMQSVTAEVLMLTPLALIVLYYNHETGGGHFATSDLKTTSLLIFSGFLTGMPLILFSFASQWITMASVGMVQYLNPTIQFLVALFVFSEPFNVFYGITFGFIWIALIIYSISSYSSEN